MPFVKVYIHFVWGTRRRIPYLNSLSLRKRVWNHIKKDGQEKGIDLDSVNGHNDHCHCLVRLGANQTLSEVAKQLKGESANWINKLELTEEHFNWQLEYYAVSVSESAVQRVRKYIKNQEEHHESNSFEDELNELEKNFGFKKIKG